MFDENSKFLLKRNSYFQNAFQYSLEALPLTKISSQFLISATYVESFNDLSDVNLIKGQKTAILKSVLQTKPRFDKTDEKVIIKFKSTDVKEICKALVLIEVLKGHVEATEESIKTEFQDALLKLRRLDFFKINIEALRNVTISFTAKELLDYNLVIWHINEICN